MFELKAKSNIPEANLIYFANEKFRLAQSCFSNSKATLQSRATFKS
jgi:hypothetical protein